jgi:hypothetical protein
LPNQVAAQCGAALTIGVQARRALKAWAKTIARHGASSHACARRRARFISTFALTDQCFGDNIDGRRTRMNCS